GMDAVFGGPCAGDKCGGVGVNTGSFWENVENLPSIGVEATPEGEGLVNTANFWEGVSGPAESGFPNDALVVRGGVRKPETLEANLATGGISANSHPDATVEELSRSLPQKHIGVTTVGDVRAIGGDVVATPTANNLFHVDIVLGPGGTQE